MKYAILSAYNCFLDRGGDSWGTRGASVKENHLFSSTADALDALQQSTVRHGGYYAGARLVAVEEIPGKATREEVPLGRLTECANYAAITTVGRSYIDPDGNLIKDINYAKLHQNINDAINYATDGGWFSFVIGVKVTYTKPTYRIIEIDEALNPAAH